MSVYAATGVWNLYPILYNNIYLAQLMNKTSGSGTACSKKYYNFSAVCLLFSSNFDVLSGFPAISVRVC